MRALSKAVQSAQAAIRDAEPGLDAANKTLKIDFAGALRSGQFAEEVIRVAERAGLRGRAPHPRRRVKFPGSSFPKRRYAEYPLWQRKAPQHYGPQPLSDSCKSFESNKGPFARCRSLLNAIERIYLLRTQDKLGIPVPIQAIYELLTPLPGQRDEYTEIDFVADLYALQRAGTLKSSDDRRLELPREHQHEV